MLEKKNLRCDVHLLCVVTADTLPLLKLDEDEINISFAEERQKKEGKWDKQIAFHCSACTQFYVNRNNSGII